MSKNIEIESKVTASKKEPRVILKWGKEQGELTPDEARSHALSILMAADAAESDAYLVKFFTKMPGEMIRKALIAYIETLGYSCTEVDLKHEVISVADPHKPVREVERFSASAFVEPKAALRPPFPHWQPGTREP